METETMIECAECHKSFDYVRQHKHNGELINLCRACYAEYTERCYKIVRMYFSSKPKRTIESGLTLKEAQAHCADPNTSSRTATSAKARAITRRNGDWFDGYDKMY